MQLDAQLHDVVYDATKNRALAKVAKMVRNQIMGLWFIVKGDEPVFSAMIEDWKQLYKTMNYPAASGRSIKGRSKQNRPKGRGIRPRGIEGSKRTRVRYCIARTCS